MRLESAGIVHRLLKSLTVSLAEYAVCASEHFGALLLDIRAETVDVAGNFDLLAQRQVLYAPDDGFDDGHSATN
jgi:hypothetical protein